MLKERKLILISSAAKRIISVLLAVFVMTAIVPTDFADAVMSTVQTGTSVKSYISSDTMEYEYVKGTIVSPKNSKYDRLKLNVRTQLESTLFRVSLYKIKTASSKSKDLGLEIYVEPEKIVTEDGVEYYEFTTTINMKKYGIKSGNYYVYIHRAATEEDKETRTFDDNAVFYKNMEIKVTKYNPRIVVYKDVMKNNINLIDIASVYDMDTYLDQSISDIKFVMKNPATGYYDTMTASKIQLFNSVSSRICEGLTTDFEKSKALYEFVASNFYYDVVAFQEHALQYADPYQNLYNQQNKKTSVNSKEGRVYTTCQGFSAIYLCLARAQDIPTRFAYGHHLAVPSNNWLTETGIDVRDHWWAESYINGKWEYIDCTLGSYNKYNKTTDVFQYTGLTNYTHFCPSDEQVAQGISYFNHFPDYRNGRYVDDPEEISKIQSFLTKNNNGVLMNAGFKAYDKSTWGDQVYAHWLGTGNGFTTRIQWYSKGLKGDVDFSGFRMLNTLKLYDNEITSVDVADCTKLKTLFLYNNNITSIDLSNCYKLTNARCRNNPLKALIIYLNDENRSFEATGHGTFSFNKTVSGKITIYSNPDFCYKLGGIYSASTNKNMGSSNTVTMKPTSSLYQVTFIPDPDSYVYDMYVGDGIDVMTPYIQALAVRLNELGYYKSKLSYGYYSNIGKETSYTLEMSKAVEKFQVMHNLENTGNIDKETWSRIFRYDAFEMVSDSEYNEILKVYNAVKEEERLRALEALALAEQEANENRSSDDGNGVGYDNDSSMQ